MGFPSRAKIGHALLIHIYENGGEKHAVLPSKAYEPLADRLELSIEDRKVSRKELYGDQRTEPAWHSAVQYARRALVKQGLISREEVGVWMLTPEGISVAARLSGRDRVP